MAETQAPPKAVGKRSHVPRKGRQVGIAQLSLVEHALCPLDTGASLAKNFVHESHYYHFDKHGHRKKVTARILCPDGLTASDEFYLWGLLALTFSQPEPSGEFYATPYYCLRQLGCVEASSGRGGHNFDLFTQAIYRLSAVTYQNDRFYDPIRSEHRRVGFGFLSYSLPARLDSSRAWRFVWDPLFFELCHAARGSLRFDLPTYRALDPASRRLYLLLKKIFWRRETSPDFDLRHLAVHVLGFSDSHETWKLKQKVGRCIETLLGSGVLRLPPGANRVQSLFTNRAKGAWTVRLLRGPHFDLPLSQTQPDPADSAAFGQLESIGFEPAAIRRILKAYKPSLIAQWADITLAARERNGDGFFTKSPPAYFLDNLKAAESGKRTPPDWWRQLRKEEDQKRRQANVGQIEEQRERRTAEEFDRYLEQEARDTFDRVTAAVFDGLTKSGMSAMDAKDRAQHIARGQLRSRFHRDHPGQADDGPLHLGGLFDAGRD